MEKTACFGKCPIYIISMNGDGAATLNAKRFMDSLGSFESLMDKEVLCGVFTTAKNCEWTGYDKEYLSGYSDLPSTVLRYSSNQKDTFTVRFENQKAPAELLLIAEKLKNVQQDTDWKRVSKSALD